MGKSKVEISPIVDSLPPGRRKGKSPLIYPFNQLAVGQGFAVRGLKRQSLVIKVKEFMSANPDGSARFDVTRDPDEESTLWVERVV
jgi:hypothetical protein